MYVFLPLLKRAIQLIELAEPSQVNAAFIAAYLRGENDANILSR